MFLRKVVPQTEIDALHIDRVCRWQQESKFRNDGHRKASH